LRCSNSWYYFFSCSNPYKTAMSAIVSQIVQRPIYQTNCSLCDKSTKIGTNIHHYNLWWTFSDIEACEIVPVSAMVGGVQNGCDPIIDAVLQCHPKQVFFWILHQNTAYKIVMVKKTPPFVQNGHYIFIDCRIVKWQY